MTEITTIIGIAIPSLIAIGGIVFGWLKNADLKVSNDKLQAVIDAGQKEAVATDYYIRSMSDGKLTVEEGDQFKEYAADAIVSHLKLIEKITGVPIYNHEAVPDKLPLGGSREPTKTETSDQNVATTQTPAQPVEQQSQSVTQPAGA